MFTLFCLAGARDHAQLGGTRLNYLLTKGLRRYLAQRSYEVKKPGSDPFEGKRFANSFKLVFDSSWPVFDVSRFAMGRVSCLE